ncbi:MAG: Glu-tRNA(Gln) amidotransferase subunit GatE [Candidatus Woesearchaeota archaeon]
MAEKLDYSKIGLKAGLEIHQQLDTKKLFCSCPSIIRDDAPDNTIRRILRASAGETGQVDVAASAEMEKKKTFQYEYYTDSNCLVELDECPPNAMNNDALDLVLQFALMTNSEVVSQIHVMRKTVVDGSNTTGFQRTALIARNGVLNLELSNSETLTVGVDTLCLEEDAARIIKRDKDQDIYRLDRLGIPLIEIATAPDMHTPSEVKEVAAFIGMLLRSTGKVKRGLGTIRQDVNVSVAGGERAEIKGVQDLKLIDMVVELEALRQLTMLKLREEMIIKGINIDLLTSDKDKIYDFTEDFKNLTKGFIKTGIDSGLKIFGKAYPLFSGFFGYEINPNRRFGTELSDRIKVLGLNGLIHTDENLEKYGISENVKHIYHKLGLGSEDGMIFILGSTDKCILAFKKIDDAIQSFIKNGLSKEVRNAKEDGTSQFLRPMPGSSRMYPETDIPIVYPDTNDIKKPELVKDKIERFIKDYSIPRQIAKELVYDPNFELFIKKYPQIKVVTIAESLSSMLKDIKTRYSLDVNPSIEQYDQIFTKLNTNEITKEAVFEILLAIGKNEQGKIIDFSKYQTNEDELIEFITKTISEKPNLNTNAVMGLVMKEYRGKYSGQKILELIKKYKGE